jgi:preprotein translocase subunit YajC
MTMSLLPLLSAAGAAPPSGMQAFMQSGIIPIAGMFVVFWFLIMRPQMRRQKELAAKIGGIKKGDQVLTGGGFLAKVIKVDDHYVDLELGPNVRVKALKSTIADIVPPGGATPAND